MKRRLLAILLAMSMLFTLLPGNVAMADGGDSGTGPVAKIGTTEYDTLDEAIKAVQDGTKTEAIEILKDCTATSDRQFFGQSMTINGSGHTIAFEHGFCLGENSKNPVTVTLENATINMNDIQTGCNGNGEWTWTGGVVINPTATFTVKNSTLNIEKSAGSGIYCHRDTEINFIKSAVNLNNNKATGLDKDNGPADVNITEGSTVNINDNEWNGISNAFSVIIDNSVFNANNNTNAGSNAANDFYIKNHSKVTLSNNGGYGMSAGDLTIDDASNVECNNNGSVGIRVRDKMTMDGTSIVKTLKNKTAGLRLSTAGQTAKIEKGAELYINNNLGNGLENYRNTVFDEGVILEVMGNNEKNNGGGVYNGGSGNLTLPSAAKIYNNHANISGDDIHSKGTITFGKTGNDWQLDNSENMYRPKAVRCNDKIDGWYQDGAEDHWNAHTNPTCVEEFTGFNEEGLITVEATSANPLTLKAAHGLIPQVVENNKSKEATNLDGNYESEITLALPHDTEEPVPDPVEPKAAPSENEFADISWGSRVEDYMGYVEGDYDFDFINDAKRLSVSVNGETYPAVKIEDNYYGFKPVPAVEPMSIANPEDGTSDSLTTHYEYYFEYFPAENGEEYFIWHIDTTVGAFDDVQLHYAVKLTNPKSEPGTYGQYDKDGSQDYEGLYTNNSAILYPVNEQEREGVPEIYNKPTVSYNVAAPTPTPTPTPNPNPIPIDPAGPEDLNTVDHYSYIVGYPDGTVRPEGKITRGEVATIFFRLLTDEARNEGWSQTNNFSDVPADTWYSNAISTLTNMGVLSGYKDGTFRPNAPITRAEYATIAVSFYKETVKDYQGTFSDVPQGQWYTQYVETAAALGLISGYPDGTFAPNKNISRAEACTITNQTLNRKPCKDHLLPVEEMINWPDNQPDAWYYYDMQEATNSHDYEWDGDKEKWTTKLSQRDWVQLEKEWSEANSATGGGEVKDENK